MAPEPLPDLSSGIPTSWSDLGSHVGLALWPGPLGSLWNGPLYASRHFLMLLCCLPDPLLRMPGGGDTENGEELKVGGDTPGLDSCV